jgi:4-cresol dehydrogenase (hydroxylating)
MSHISGAVQSDTYDPVPEVTAEIFDRLSAVVGAEWIISDTEALRDYRDPYGVPGDEQYSPSIAVLPRTVEQIQGILRIANDTGIPVWTHSQGRNNGYGGPSPRVGGSITISLRQMNRVLEINEELAYAVVEPGVRWFDLHEALRARGSALMVSVPDLGWGSVVGNSLDNGVTYLPNGSDFQAPTGMEVVLADGDVVRTGMGAIPESKSWHLYKRGLGPVLDPLFMQSNYGIVSKMGVWLMPAPEAYAPLRLTIASDSDLGAAIDCIRTLRLRGVLCGVPSLYNTLMAATMTGQAAVIAAAELALMPEDQIQQAAESTGLGRWYVRAALWGDRVVVDHQINVATELWTAIPGARITVPGIYAPDEYGQIESISDRITVGIPNLDVLRHKGDSFGHIGFSPIVPLTGQEVSDVVDMLREEIEQATGQNFKCGILVLNDRACAVVSSINFDPRIEYEARAAYATARQLVAKSGARGYGEYRAHLDFMDVATDQFSFNNMAFRRLCEKIKDALDPKGILSPGRYGIWPTAMRSHRHE